MHMNRERTRPFTQNISGQYIDTSKEREKTVDFMTFSSNWKTKLMVFLPKLQYLWILLLDIVFEFLKLVIVNQRK